MSPVSRPQAPLHLYNTQSRRKEVFEPLEPGIVRMYNCGPTVYDYFHVGNARNFVVADLVRRYFEYRGYRVVFVQNITDIEDKIIARAQREGCTPRDITDRFTKVFFESSALLGVRKADHHPCATDYVGKMIRLVKQLEQKGFAYQSEGDVYFRVTRFEGYGKLSGRKIEDMISGARVEVSEKKEHPADFVLWKGAREGEPSWPSPWGPGRPGWHLECSAMSMDLLGETFDIHMGGNDLTFPHHENEIAQSEAATGKPFVRYWMHNGFLNINGEKMSKSLGNFFTINEVLEKFAPGVVRYFLLGAHYRAPLDFSDASLGEAAAALDRLREARKAARELAGNAAPDAAAPDPECDALFADFQEAMDDDFNTPRALAVLFQCASRINRLQHAAQEAVRQGGTPPPETPAQAAALGAVLDELGGAVLGLDLELPPAAVEALGAQLLDLLILVRSQARAEKQWGLADCVRKGLAELGFELLDRPGGVTEWKRK